MLKLTTGSISNCFTLTTAGGQFESLQGVMRENLIFSGVTEQYEQSGDGTYTENTEQVLYEFLQDEMNISERFPLD